MISRENYNYDLVNNAYLHCSLLIFLTSFSSEKFSGTGGGIETVFRCSNYDIRHSLNRVLVYISLSDLLSL